VNTQFQPDLDARFHQPAAWEWKDRIETRPGQYIRAGWVIPQDAKALVVILPGLSEYGEKYFEVAHDLLARGYAVAVMDWRGQGKAWRYDTDRRVHDDFANDVQDAAIFIGMIPVPAGMPRVLLAHSMGAHIGLRFMHGVKDAFRCAVLTAPMLGIKMPFAEGLVRRIIAATHRLGLGRNYLPHNGPWTEPNFEANLLKLTTDSGRIGMQRYWMKNTDLRMGGLTFDWVRAAFASMDTLRQPAYLAEIKTPILILAAENEQIVSNAAIKATVKHLPHAEHEVVPGAMHEVLMEQDVYRKAFWDRFDPFVAKFI